MSEAQNGGNVMERLTFDGNFCDIAQCTSTPGGSLCEDGSCSARKVWERLKAYEDTHMMPSDVTSMRMDMAIIVALFNGVDVDRMKELAEADKEGRLVVLPCKVGDVVYGFHGEKTILPMVVKWIETYTNGWCIAVQYAQMAPRFYRFSDFGKTVFLTHEEAKKALEAIKDE